MRWILLLYALLCFLVAGGLLFKKSGKSTIWLGVFTLMFGIEIVDFLYGTSQLKSIYPQYFGYYYFLSGFLYGPLLLWHFRFSFKPKLRFSFWQLAHFIPLFVVLFYIMPILIMPAVERITYIKLYFHDIIMPVNYARALHLLSYGIVLIIYLFQNRYLLKPKNKLYAYSIILIYFISCVMISWLTQFANTWRDFDLYYFIACNIVFIIGILLYIDPNFLSEIAQKYLKSAISYRDKKRIKKKIIDAFSEAKPFTRNDFNLTELAALIDEKNHHISQTFSEEFEEGFHSFVNKHRVEYAKVLLVCAQHQKYTIEAIGQEAGFNNRVSFNKAFKQYTSLTPSEYRKNQMA